MNNNDWMEKLPSNIKSVVSGFSDSAKGKIKEKLDAGFRISEANYSEVEVVKGFSYYGISRGGSVYSK
jgi:hypothetical protein